MTDSPTFDIPDDLREKAARVAGITDAFSRDLLDVAFAQLARQMVAALGAHPKRPLERGRPHSWAAGVLYALAQVNDLFSKDSPFYLSATTLCDRIGVSQGTASKYARRSRELLKIDVEGSEWTRSALVGSGDGGPDENRDPRSMDKIIRNVQELVRGKEFASMDELNDYLRTVLMESGGVVPEPSFPSRTPLQRAQELIYQAFESGNREDRIRLAREALVISEDCADAYVLLAGLDADTRGAVRSLYERGVAAGERNLDDELFDEQAGHFWGILETRPYMRARRGLAEVCLMEGEVEEAIGHLREMMRLGARDAQGNRYLLADALLAAGREKEVVDLLEEYEDDYSANFTYNRALALYWLHGKGGEADRALEEALELNPHVPEFLLERRAVPDRRPTYHGVGDENEAILYAVRGVENWQRTPGATDWLARRMED